MDAPVDLYADRWLRSNRTYLSAMDRCTPGSALAPGAARGRWRLLPYRSPSLSGTAIVAGQETEAPPVRLAVNARGWHAISIGAWRLKPWYFGLHDDGGPAQLLVRFAGDPTFSILHLPTQPGPRDPIADWHKHTGGEELSECFWQVAELNGADLEFGQAQWLETAPDGAERTRCAMASVAYVKLVPLTECRGPPLHGGARGAGAAAVRP